MKGFQDQMNKIIIFNFLIFSILHPQPTEVTFIVDMSQQAVQAGDGDYPAVYVSGGNINGPAGLEMNDNGDGIWSLTTQLNPDSYTYKFRNGYYNYWDGPGWENDQNLIAGDCAYGQYNDRIFTLIAITTWIFAGNIFLNIFKNNIQRKLINYFLSITLVITAIWIILT